ncbi:hypothetical protein BC834DRAFT_417974, partial [Gloeopeniophorella convolvens]
PRQPLRCFTQRRHRPRPRQGKHSRITGDGLVSTSPSLSRPPHSPSLCSACGLSLTPQYSPYSTRSPAVRQVGLSVHVSFAVCVPPLRALLGLLVTNIVDKDHACGDADFGDAPGSFLLMVGGLAGSIVLLVFKHAISGYQQQYQY